MFNNELACVLDSNTLTPNVFFYSTAEASNLNTFHFVDKIALPSSSKEREEIVRTWSKKNKHLSVILLIPLAACGSGSSNSDDTSLSGFVIDDYLRDATVFRDLNGNNSFDNGETFTNSNSDGSFRIGGDNTAPLVVTGGFDINTGKEFIGVLKRLAIQQ